MKASDLTVATRSGEPKLARMEKSASELYRSMLWIRMCERSIAQRYRGEQMRCPVHLSIGQEGAAVAVCSALGSQDRVFSTHRSHAHYLAKGGDLDAMLLEIHGKQGGCCEGRGGSMHLFDESVGFAASVPIVGANIPLAVGAALAKKQRGESGCVVAFLGDGAAEEGVFHESLNFAALFQLPVLFAVEHNRFSVYTPIEQRQPKSMISRFALAHGIPHANVTASEVQSAHRHVLALLAGVDMGRGPALIELETYRFVAHCGPEQDDALGYRCPKEVAEQKARCPLSLTKASLLASGEMKPCEISQLSRRYQAQIDRAFERACSAPFPEPSSVDAHVFAQAQRS